MNISKIKNVAIISNFEENENAFRDFLLKNNGDYKINIVSIPQYVDLTEKVTNASEVADEIVLLVDGVEGVVPTITTMLRQLLNLNLKPIVVVNKIDKPDANAEKAVNEVIDVLVTAYASDEQLEFPVIYISEEKGTATLDLEIEGTDLNPLFDTIIENS